MAWGCALCGEPMPAGVADWMEEHRKVCTGAGGPVDAGQEGLVRVRANLALPATPHPRCRFPHVTPAEQKALEALHRWLHSPAGDCVLIEGAEDYHTQVGGEAGDAPACQQLELEEREATNEIFDVNEMGISPLVQAAIRELQKTGRYGATVGETMAHVLRAGIIAIGDRETGMRWRRRENEGGASG
jgi:hypothetical protein